jgi:hypothetical protein
MVNDGRGVPSRRARASALLPLFGVGDRLLVGPFGDGQALDADEQPGVVRHGEHVVHPLVGLADQVALGTVEAEHAGGTGVDAELVLDRRAGNAVTVAELSVFADEHLWAR